MMEIKEKNNKLYLTPKFDLDINNQNKVSAFREKVISLIKEKNINIVILNLEYCSFIDSFGLGHLLRIYEQIHLRAGKFFVCNLSNDVENLFDITNLSEFFIKVEDVNSILEFS